MNTVRSQSFIIGCMAGTALLTFADELVQGDVPAARTILGVGAASIFLAIIALWSANLAASLAGLILVATIFNSSGLLSAIVKITK